MTTDSQPDQNGTQIQGLLRRVFQAGWLLLVGLALGTFVAAIPVLYNYLASTASPADPALITGLNPMQEAVFLSRLGEQEANSLQTSGLSHQFYAGYILAFEIVLALISGVTGIFIFWRRSDDWLTLWVSLILILLGTNGPSPTVFTLVTVWPGGLWASTVGAMIGMVSNVYLLFLSPDGRFVPRWSRYLAAGFAAGMLTLFAVIIVVVWRRGLFQGMVLSLISTPVWIGLCGLGVFSQIYRYRRISRPVQRQQTKWVVVGLAAVSLGFLINTLLIFTAGTFTGQPQVLVQLIRAPVVNLCVMLLPVCLGLSILRYRLWDIDFIIRRTLVYSSLTVALALLYLSSIVMLQSLFGAVLGDRQTQLVVVLSTVAIAALSIPLRRRIQDAIDRRFYRRKYDAERVLAAFSSTLRDEVDLDRLTNTILNLVEETMKPAHLSWWYRELPSSEPPEASSPIHLGLAESPHPK